MPTYELRGPDGARYQLTAPDEHAAMSAFSAFSGGAQPQKEKEPDIYQQAALADFERQRAAGVPVGESNYARRMLQGMTFNAADEIIAAGLTPIEMIRRGTFNPAEGYRYAKAREDLEMERARKTEGALGTMAEIAGGGFSGGGLASQGVTFVRSGAGLPARIMGGAADAGAMGAVQGGFEGNTLQERGANALSGATLGGVFGGGVPVAGAALAPVIGPGVSYARALINPRGVAESQIARGVQEAGRTGQQIADDVAQAAREGQTMFAVADAMGNPGQRMLSTVTRAPGRGRTEAVEFLDQRQAGQARRVANAVAEGFEAPQTAQQTQTALTARRAADAEVNYGAAQAQAGSVNVSPVLEAIDNSLQPGVARMVNPQTGIADNSIEGALRRARSYLADGRSQVSDFNAAFMAKREIDAMIETASPTVQRALIPVRNALDDQLAAASQPYAAARNQFRQQSQAIEAVDAGRNAAMRGRTEDTIPAFQAMRPDQQAAYRAGYADPLIAQAQGSAYGVNAARPLTSDAFRTEAQAMAPGNALMQRRLEREGRMFETRSHATGNSRTADNLADMEGMRVDPSIVTNLLSGNVGAAASNALSRSVSNLSGYTPAVREELSQILLRRAQTVGDLPQIIARVAQRKDALGRFARDVSRSLYGAGTNEVAQYNRTR